MLFLWICIRFPCRTRVIGLGQGVAGLSAWEEIFITSFDVKEIYTRMRWQAFIVIDLLALAFAVATLWLLYDALQRQKQSSPHVQIAGIDSFEDDEVFQDF